MPTYEYACAACDTRHEVQQKMTDDSLTVCPSCGDPSLRKIFTNVGVVFKGSGFYATDNRTKGKSNAATRSGSSTSSESGSTGSSESSSSAPAVASAPSPASAASTPAA